MVDFQNVRFGNERKNVLNVLERVKTEDYSSRWEIWRVVRDGVTDRTMGTMVRERVLRVPSGALELSLFNRACKFGNVPYPCSAKKQQPILHVVIEVSHGLSPPSSLTSSENS